jgi:hypothetical protein
MELELNDASGRLRSYSQSESSQRTCVNCKISKKAQCICICSRNCCIECKEEDEICMSCTVNRIEKRSLSLTHISDKRNSCRYKENGCKELLYQFLIQNHELLCEFQEVICEGCKKAIILNNISEHKMSCLDIEITCPKCHFIEKRKNFSHSCAQVIYFRKYIDSYILNKYHPLEQKFEKDINSIKKEIESLSCSVEQQLSKISQYYRIEINHVQPVIPSNEYITQFKIKNTLDGIRNITKNMDLFMIDVGATINISSKKVIVEKYLRKLQMLIHMTKMNIFLSSTILNSKDSYHYFDDHILKECCLKISDLYALCYILENLLQIKVSFSEMHKFYTNIKEEYNEFSIFNVSKIINVII